MRFKIITLFLALSAVSWAQSATQTSPSAPLQSTTSEKAKCSCCEKMSSSDMKDKHGDMKDMHACCSHDDAMAGDHKDMTSHHKEMASCCEGKDGGSCMKAKDAADKACCGDKCSKDTTAASCCGGKDSGDKCSKDGKACCSSEKKSARNCCADRTRG